MNTYLLPISDGKDCWIEKILATSITNAESKLVSLFADDYDFIDYGDTLHEAIESLNDHGFTVGELYDLEEF